MADVLAAINGSDSEEEIEWDEEAYTLHSTRPRNSVCVYGSASASVSC